MLSLNISILITISLKHCWPIASSFLPGDKQLFLFNEDLNYKTSHEVKENQTTKMNHLS